MKKLITVLCLMIGLAGAGQELKSFDPANPKYKIDSVVAPKYDTIPIIYLYCDTARITRITEEYQMRNGKLFIERDTFYYDPNYELRWDFGYEVLEVYKGFWPLHIGYLDRQKNPIRTRRTLAHLQDLAQLGFRGDR